VGANLLVVPLAALLTTGGVLTLAVAAVSEPLAHPLFQSLWLLLTLLRLAVRGAAALPGAIVYLAPPPIAAVAVIGLVLVLLPWVRGRWATAGLVALVGGATALTIGAAWPEGLVRVVVLDVGQGEAILVQAPEGATLLVDTGGGGPGRGDRGERVVVPALRHLGIRRLTALALTEGAPDHAGGLTGLRAGVPIGEVWSRRQSRRRGSEPVVARDSLTALRRGDRRWIGSVLVSALHPLKAEADVRLEPAARAAGPCSGSISLFAVVLATGSGAGAEAAVLRTGQPLSASVLKVSGNGSRRGSRPEFLAGVEPRGAVIPVSARNPFGHPAPAVLARLGAVGAMVYRTDRDGAVDIRSDGRRV
jgi:competence protein ComEC